MSKTVPVLLFALTFPAVMTWFYFAQGGPPAKPIYTIGKVIQFALPLLWWAATDRSRLRLPKPSTSGLPAGLLFGTGVAIAIFAPYFGWLKQGPLAETLAAQARIKTAAFGIDSPPLFLLFALFLSVIHAFLEEYYWRAFVFAELRKITPLAAAVAISSIGFMAHHVIVLAVYFPGRFWTLAMPFSLAVAAGGAVWAIFYARFRSILPGWLSHSLIDAAIMLVGYDLLFRS